MLNSLSDREPTIEAPISQACTHSQFLSPIYQHWCDELKEPPRFHRKQWEFVYILQALNEHGLLKPGMRGLGFGVGLEPLPAYFASLGLEIMATDLPPSDAKAAGWANSDQHASSLEALNRHGRCDSQHFQKLVSFEYADMNHIPAHYTGFDFTWSSCCFEHLGSIKAGLAFVENSLKALKPGGLAVHTTEFNCSSNWRTISKGSTVLFRKKDIQKLADRLLKAGHHLKLNFFTGEHELDRYIDLPPYKADRHLKLKFGRYATTSFGMLVEKASGGVN